MRGILLLCAIISTSGISVMAGFQIYDRMELMRLKEEQQNAEAVVKATLAIKQAELAKAQNDAAAEFIKKHGDRCQARFGYSSYPDPYNLHQCYFINEGRKDYVRLP